MTLMKKKPVQAAIALVLTAGIALAGTFAWSSFNQSRINVFNELMVPDVNLHDDFEGGPNKDVYVENSGGSPIFLRVRLTEYLQTDGRGSLVEGHVRDDDKAYLWAPHNATDTVETCVLVEPNRVSASWNGENFHDYYTWLMGGQSESNPTAQIYYKPATPEQKSIFAEDGTTVIQEPQVVSDPLTGTSTAGDASVDYAAQVEAKIAELKAAPADAPLSDADAEAQALAELGLKKTNTASVITMTEWIAGKGAEGEADYRAPFAQGDFWVIDEADGWAYWANALPGGQATGLLLDKVNRTEKQFDSNAEYAINVWLQAVTEDDLGQFAANGGGISDNGMKLLQLATGKIAIAADGAIYAKNADGTYVMTTNPDGTPATDAKTFVALGNEGVNTPAENRLEIGQRVTIDELTWDGTDYTDYAAQAAKTAPWYNVTRSAVTDAAQDGGKQLYEVTGAQIGADKNIYLMVQLIVEEDGAFVPDANTTLYLASVSKSAEGAYSQTAPGTAPFGFIWPNANGGIGTSTDGRLDPTVTLENRSFQLLGNGVYLETTAPTAAPAAEGAATPVTYFFAGKNITKTAISGVTGTVDEKVAALFPLQLAVGNKFDITGGDTTGGATNPVTGYTLNNETGAYTFSGLTKGVDGDYYIYLGSAKAGYIGPGADKFLGAVKDATPSDVRTWDGGMGIGSSTDTTTAPGDFSEGFLSGKTSEDLAEGNTLTVDGYNWTVIEVDEFGNRLLLTDTAVSSMGARATANSGNYPYASTSWPARATAFTNTLTSLKPYAMGVNIPMEPVYTAGEIYAASDGLSTCASSQSGATAFVPSASDINTYIRGNVELDTKLYNGKIYSIRSQVQGSSGSAIYGAAVNSANKAFNSDSGLGLATDGKVCFYDQYHKTNYPPRMAIWVRFSDADSIATASPEALSRWQKGLPATIPAAGDTFVMGNASNSAISWVALKVEGTKALVISENAFLSGKYGSGTYSTWAASSARTMLNGSFLQNAFTAQQRQAIVPADRSGTFSDLQSGDKVFLLSGTEYESLVPAGHKAVNPVGNVAQDLNYALCRDGNGAYMMLVDMSGTVTGYIGSAALERYIRPAMWVDFSA